MQAMDHTSEESAPRRRGIVDTIKGFMTDVLGATRNRVEDFSAEVQHRSLKLLWMIIWSVLGVVSLWFALCFSVLTIIFGFDLPPKYAFGIPALVFFVVSLLALVMFQRTKRSKRETSDYGSEK
jgi:uncharacterized membrane protein YqjE